MNRIPLSKVCAFLFFFSLPLIFFFFISKHLLKVKSRSLGKANPPVGGAPATSLKPRRTEKPVAAFSRSTQPFLLPSLHVREYLNITPQINKRHCFILKSNIYLYVSRRPRSSFPGSQELKQTITEEKKENLRGGGGGVTGNDLLRKVCRFFFSTFLGFQ